MSTIFAHFQPAEPPYLGIFSVNLFEMTAVDGHDMQPPSNPHELHAPAKEKIAEQAKEIQQLREQLARTSVKEGPTLPPLSVPELNKALERPQPQWRRLMLSNLKAYVRLRAEEVGGVPRPAESKGIIVL